MSLQEPGTRKRPLSDASPADLKKYKMEPSQIISTESQQALFSDKMYATYVKSALESLDKVCTVIWEIFEVIEIL